MKLISLVFLMLVLPHISHAVMIPEEQHHLMIRKLQNPVTHLITLPLFYDVDVKNSDHDDTLNFKPVVPIKINPNWNLVTRGVMEHHAHQGVSEGDFSFYLSRTRVQEEAILWGVGPIVSFSEEEKTAFGLSAVVFDEDDGPLAYGALVKELFHEEESETRLELFFNYTFENSYSLFLETEDSLRTEDKVLEGEVTAGVYKMINLKEDTLSLGLGLRGLSHGPEEERFDWGARFILAYLMDK